MADPAINTGFPQSNSPWLDPSGRVAQIWLRLLITLWNRTGGAQGGSTDTINTQLESILLPDVQATPDTELDLSFMDGFAQEIQQENSEIFLMLGEGQEQGWPCFFPEPCASPGALLAWTLGASPAQVGPGWTGTWIISAGTVSSVQLTRGGVTVNCGQVAGMFPVTKSDFLTITYTVAPTVTFAGA